MARDNRLRRTKSESPARTGRFAFLQSRALVGTAAILAVVAAAFAAVHQLAGIGRTKALAEPAFLTEALGAPQASAPLVRKPAPSIAVTIEQGGGYTVAGPGRSVTLAPQANIEVVEPTTLGTMGGSFDDLRVGYWVKAEISGQGEACGCSALVCVS